MFKNIGGMVCDCDCSGNVCTGQVAVGFQCKIIIIIESLNPTVTFSGPEKLPKVCNGVLREHHCWKGVQWRVT